MVIDNNYDNMHEHNTIVIVIINTYYTNLTLRPASRQVVINIYLSRYRVKIR